MKSWRAAAVLLLCLALVGSTACSPFGGDQEETSQQLVEVVRGDLIVSVSGSGNIAVSNEARLVFGTSGRIDKIFIDDGDEVAKGKVLAKLDTAPLELALTQAQVALAQAQIARTQAQIALQTAEYNLKEAQEPYTEQEISNAEAAVDEAEYYLWYAEMKEENAWEEPTWAVAQKRYWEHEVYRARLNLGIAQQNLDTILSGTDEDEIAILEMQIEATKQSLELARQSLELAQQSLELAQTELDEATLTAPFDGAVVSVDVDEGDTVSTATPIVHLIDLSSIELKAEVDEIDIADVKPGQRAIIEVDALPALQLEGKVTSISLLSEETGGVVLYEVTIGFDVPQGYNLKIGMSAIADIVIDERSNVLLVPNRAITQDSQGNPIVQVMVDEEIEEIEERPVVLGISDGFLTEIVDGLEEGEVVKR